ncbi:MAG: peptidoglycan-binding protein [Polyangiaceae bacterium]|nr:peptidoglycan-binding protein [Polyangiaceae bacterium]
MAQYVVRQGDCFASIAAHWGIDVDELSGLGDNDRYSEEGHSPHQLRPGDVVEVPDQPPNRATSFSSGGSKTYSVPIPTVQFRMRLKDQRGRAHADKRYELVVSERTYEGRTDGDGWLEQRVPARATDGDLFVWLNDADEHPWEIPLTIGGLDPSSEETGVVQRLHNLGFGTAFNGKEGLTQALEEFQRSEGLAATGLLDDGTRDRLRARSSE